VLAVKTQNDLGAAELTQVLDRDPLQNLAGKIDLDFKLHAYGSYTAILTRRSKCVFPPDTILPNETYDSVTSLRSVLLGAGPENCFHDHRRRRCRRSLPPGPDRAKGLRDAPTADRRNQRRCRRLLERGR